MNFKIKALILCCLIAVLPLTACTLLAVGGAATVGGLALTDRRTVGAQTDDQTIEMSVKSQMSSYLNAKSSAGTVSVTSYNRNVLLLGVVANEEEKQVAERLARSQQNVRNVYNHIAIGDKYNEAAQDTWITSKIRTMLLKPNGFYPNHVKVVTFNRITYVMGILTAEEQAAANSAISTTSGVEKVVTLYETFTQSNN